MKVRNLVKSGVEVSGFGLGTNRFGSEKTPQSEIKRIINHALELGSNHNNTANAYQN